MKKEITRPKLNTELQPIDRLALVVGSVFILFMAGMTAFYYKNLPESIAISYGFNGEPKGFGNKGLIWILPAFGFMIYAGIVIINQFPHLFNYPVRINYENADRQYKLATRLLRFINVTIAGFFCYLDYSIIQTSLGKQNGPDKYFLIVFVSLIFLMTGIYIHRSVKEK